MKQVEPKPNRTFQNRWNVAQSRVIIVNGQHSCAFLGSFTTHSNTHCSVFLSGFAAKVKSTVTKANGLSETMHACAFGVTKGQLLYFFLFGWINLKQCIILNKLATLLCEACRINNIKEQKKSFLFMLAQSFIFSLLIHFSRFKDSENFYTKISLFTLYIKFSWDSHSLKRLSLDIKWDMQSFIPVRSHIKLLTSDASPAFKGYDTLGMFSCSKAWWYCPQQGQNLQMGQNQYDGQESAISPDLQLLHHRLLFLL